MGTVFSIEIRDAEGVAAAGHDVAAVVGEVTGWLHWVDSTFSTYDADSEIRRLERGELAYADAHPDVRSIIAEALRLAAVTGGYFSVELDGRLDPSGLVKGWAIERASDLLLARGSRRHCVNGGGDVQCRSDPDGPPWRVGVADPLRAGEILTVVTGHELAVATSGTAERGAHILDPHTGAPADALAGLTVVGAGITLTDAYATAGFAMGDKARPWIESLEGYEAFAVLPDGRRWQTAGFERYR